MSYRSSFLPKITPELKRTWRPIRRDCSSGGVAYTEIDTGGTIGRTIHIALIATRRGRRWQLPKGTCEAGESSAQTATREVWEEAGVKTEPEAFLSTIDYWYWDTYHQEPPELVYKKVEYYLLRIVGGSLNDLSHEVDAVGWFRPKRAIDVLTFQGEREIVRLALKELAMRKE